MLALTVLGAAGLWAYFVYRMSDPVDSLLFGIRIDASRISVKAPICPTDKAGKVEVFDNDSAKLLWWASGPKTPEGKRGAVTLWEADDFLKAGPGTQPRTLPANIDVAFTYVGGEGGGGETFNIRKVKAARVPEGQYWTDYGPMTAAQIDAQLNCNNGTSTPTPKPKTDGKEPTG